MQHAQLLKLVARVYTMVKPYGTAYVCALDTVQTCERLKFRNILPKLRRRRGAYTSRGTTASLVGWSLHTGSCPEPLQPLHAPGGGASARATRSTSRRTRDHHELRA